MSKNKKQRVEKKDAIQLTEALRKAAEVTSMKASDEELEAINKFTMDELEAKDVFIFKSMITQNTVDRDFEYFTKQAVEDMATKFIGRPLIKDHKWSADTQIGRIYKTELIESEDFTSTGEKLTKLIAYSYILNTDKNADLIADIKGGVIKEVSIGVNVGVMECNICGTDNYKEYCRHWWGKEYDGVTAIFKLDELVDAYELSLVAVPAMAGAGAIKRYGQLDDIAEVKSIDENTVDEQEAEELALKIELSALKTYIDENN